MVLVHDADSGNVTLIEEVYGYSAGKLSDIDLARGFLIADPGGIIIALVPSCA